MVVFSPDWDPEKRGSRFTSRAALAVLTRKGGVTRFQRAETGVATEVITDALGPDALTRDPDLGPPRAVDGSDGRGAEVWAPVIEWTVQVGIAGIVGNAAWDALKGAAARLRDLTERSRRDGVRINVSRGSAALIAIGHILDEGHEDDVIDVEFAEEPSTLGRGRPQELNYVGADPWLVSLLNATRTRRYIVVVMPDGSIGGSLGLELAPIERAYLPPSDGHV
jgi:hypothetical protein